MPILDARALTQKVDGTKGEPPANSKHGEPVGSELVNFDGPHDGGRTEKADRLIEVSHRLLLARARAEQYTPEVRPLHHPNRQHRLPARQNSGANEVPESGSKGAVSRLHPGNKTIAVFGPLLSASHLDPRLGEIAISDRGQLQESRVRRKLLRAAQSDIGEARDHGRGNENLPHIVDTITRRRRQALVAAVGQEQNPGQPPKVLGGQLLENATTLCRKTRGGGGNQDGQKQGEPHFVPAFPVYGLVLPLVEKLFDLRESGDVRTCAGTYEPDFVVCARTRTFGAAREGVANRRRAARAVFMSSNNTTLSRWKKLNAVQVGRRTGTTLAQVLSEAWP